MGGVSTLVAESGCKAYSGTGEESSRGSPSYSLSFYYATDRLDLNYQNVFYFISYAVLVIHSLGNQ